MTIQPTSLTPDPAVDVKAHVGILESLLSTRSTGGSRLLVVPGCWDAFSARLAEEAGAPAVFLGTRTVATARYGRPDADLVTFGELADIAASIREGSGIPLIVDAGGGFGNALNVSRTIKIFERAGASAVDLSDAVSPGSVHEAVGQAVVPAADMIGKLKAALDSRKDILMIARTGSARVEGLAAAFDRAEAYLEAGADLIIVDGVSRTTDLAAVATRFARRVPLIQDMGEAKGEAGVAASLEEQGFSAVLFPMALLRGMAAAAPKTLRALRPAAEARSR